MTMTTASVLALWGIYIAAPILALLLGGNR